MSRTQRDRLRYFPLDVDFFKNPAIRRLIKRFGGDGPVFYLYTLCTVYGGEGYYVLNDRDFAEDAAIDLGCTIEKIGLMLEYLLDRSLLVNIPAGTVNYLTSHGIQAQYQQSVKGKKRDVVVDRNLWILNESETEGFIKCAKNKIIPGNKAIIPGEKDINPGNIQQSKIKENKRNSSSCSSCAPARGETELGRVMAFYMDKINPTPSPIAIGEIEHYTDVLGAEVVLHAMSRALDERKTAWSYIKGILRNYKRDGLLDMGAVLASEQEHARSRDTRGAPGPPGQNRGARQKKKTFLDMYMEDEGNDEEGC